MSRRALLKLALQQRAAHEEDFPHGFRVWTGERLGGWEFGPYLPRLWRWAVALKCCVCILLGRSAASSWKDDWLEVAAWDFHGYPDEYGGWWSCLKVRWGWRPRTWRFDCGEEST